LKPGDTIAVVAPASPFPPTLGWVGLGFLARRYRVRFDRGLFSRRGYLAGDDERRRAELAAAVEAPDVRAIVAARGGFGAGRVAHRIDWTGLVRSPKWIVGFSDITALHVEAAAIGVASIHGDHVTALGQSSDLIRRVWIDVLEAPARPRAFTGLDVLASGFHEGRLFGGNLALLHACAAAGRLHVPEGAVLLLEDVGEKPFRIDRMLSTLAAGGHFEQVGAVVLGDFLDCHPNADRVTALDVLRECFAPLEVPVLAGLPVGHGRRNLPLVLGAHAAVDARGVAGVFTTGR
jgi:muramoyltetrapeptide carboxypeptidase